MEHIEFSYSWLSLFYLKFKKEIGLERVNVQGLKKTLDYLQSKQRELARQQENDTRSIESIIKYLKKDMVDRYKLADYDVLIKQDIKNTVGFISNVQKIIDLNS